MKLYETCPECGYDECEPWEITEFGRCTICEQEMREWREAQHIFFKVSQSYYDNGVVSVEVMQVLDAICPDSEFESRTNCDYYADYFDDQLAAEQFASESQNA
jgi:hypothetical protein